MFHEDLDHFLKYDVMKCIVERKILKSKHFQSFYKQFFLIAMYQM